VADGRPRRVTFTNNAQGQVLHRDEADGYTSTGDPHEIWFRFGGRLIGYVGKLVTYTDTWLNASLGAVRCVGVCHYLGASHAGATQRGLVGETLHVLGRNGVQHARKQTRTAFARL
jgi:hypothetical protein